MAKVTVRGAKFGDIPAIVSLVKDAHQRSRLSSIAFNEKAAKAMLFQSMQRHGGTVAGSTYAGVAETDEGLDGFILGALQPIYFALEGLEATDLVWVVRKGGNARAGGMLLDAMHRWARTSPHLRSIRQGTTDVISDPRAAGRLLERRGMTMRGHVYERDEP